MVRAGFAICVLAAAAAAQQAADGPRFDVISIRPVPPNAPMVMRDINFTSILPGGQFVDQRTSLLSMIGLAYEDPGMQNLSTQIVGLPKWTQNQSYEISARPAPGFPALPPEQNREQVRLMLRAMLAERFHLQLHTEMRKEPVYNLESARGGVKLKEVEAPAPPEKAGPVFAAWSDSDIRMIGKKSTMKGLAQTLYIILATPVIDQTGWQGYFDCDVRWTPPGPRTDQVGFGADGISLLMSNLESQFGVRLVKTTGEVPYWVVDHVEPPPDN